MITEISFKNHEVENVFNNYPLEIRQKLRLRDMLTDEEFVEEKNKISQEIIKIEQELKSHDNKTQKWHDLAKQTFNFAKYARERLGHFVSFLNILHHFIPSCDIL